MTDEARARMISEVLALAAERSIRCSLTYLDQVLLGLRDAPCGDDLAVLIAGYVCGFVGISMSPDDVRANIKPTPREEVSA